MDNSGRSQALSEEADSDEDSTFTGGRRCSMAAAPSIAPPMRVREGRPTGSGEDPGAADELWQENQELHDRITQLEDILRKIEDGDDSFRDVQSMANCKSMVQDISRAQSHTRLLSSFPGISENDIGGNRRGSVSMMSKASRASFNEDLEMLDELVSQRSRLRWQKAIALVLKQNQDRKQGSARMEIFMVARQLQKEKRSNEIQSRHCQAVEHENQSLKERLFDLERAAHLGSKESDARAELSKLRSEAEPMGALHSGGLAVELEDKPQRRSDASEHQWTASFEANIHTTDVEFQSSLGAELMNGMPTTRSCRSGQDSHDMLGIRSCIPAQESRSSASSSGPSDRRQYIMYLEQQVAEAGLDQDEMLLLRQRVEQLEMALRQVSKTAVGQLSPSEQSTWKSWLGVGCCAGERGLTPAGTSDQPPFVLGRKGPMEAGAMGAGEDLDLGASSSHHTS